MFFQLAKHDRSFTFLDTHHIPNEELPKFLAGYYSSQPRKTRVFQLAKHDRSVTFLDRNTDDDCLIYAKHFFVTDHIKLSLLEYCLLYKLTAVGLSALLHFEVLRILQQIVDKISRF